MTDPRSTTQPDLAAPQFPVPYGRYFLVRKLAVGGMAEIFLAKQRGAEGFERNVVIKRMLPHLSQLPDFVSMFLDEARLAARLSHPNIVQIADLGRIDGTYYICMEYLAGEDFSFVVRTASKRMAYVPLEISLKVVAEAARGLHFAHEFADESGRPLQIVHRDVSPSNIHVSYEGQVKVLDFGIAKAESRVSHTGTGVVKGKYLYMAPEQARGAPVDRRADVFSLGVSLYEALTRTRPFARDNDLAVLNAVLTQEYKRPRQVRPDLTPELEAIILRAMAPRPDDRYQTAADFALAVEEHLASSSLYAGPARVAEYLRSLMPEERIVSRTRIPSLATFAPGFTEQVRPESTAVETSPNGEIPATVAVRPASVPSPPAASPARRSSALPWLLAGLVALGSVGAAGYLVMRGRTGSTRVKTPSTAPHARASAPVPSAPPPAPAPDVQSSKQVASAPAENSHRRARHRTKPVELTSTAIQRTLGAHGREILGCFRNHRTDLPSGSAVIPVRFTILRSGRVSSAKAQGPLSETAVAHCLEHQAKRIRFPRNTARATTFIAPFQLSIAK